MPAPRVSDDSTEQRERREFWRRVSLAKGDLDISIRDMGTDPLAYTGGKWVEDDDP